MLSKLNIPEPEVNTIAKTLTAANLRGVDTHGVIMLRVYMRRFSKISMGPISIVSETNNAVVIDGGDRPGMSVANFAMDKAIEKAKTNTAGIVSARNSNHFGICSYYALKAAEQGMIGIVMTSAGKRLAPWGGLENIWGNCRRSHPPEAQSFWIWQILWWHSRRSSSTPGRVSPA